ncbi:isocitrate lyase/phosphoenolpyruvate mutase family protein [Dyadobacter sp. CY261]|uniref:isocitrate lyase/PEP mutase family protein n=1 Tax=Dyadobacter sp. CY261 TaxID=2907203 RepID=UPI001F30C0CF|nr:isocitrate lyase/phosphoenolpyruvate mutase family protein [Dyadobacter sp. CY261]MCF0073566.1 isocitrate lyase/phosphoenolpyruvate mutase family protein [Dyadobacter sp. CY261]
MSTQSEKADLLKKLHHSGKMLVLPNIWDAAGAVMLEKLGYAAVATASAAVSRAHGYEDSEHIPFDFLLTIVSQIVKSVDVPVTVDMEAGYASDRETLKSNIRRLIAAGVAGINIEDTDVRSRELVPVAEQVEKLKLIARVAERENTRLFVNARTDVFLVKTDFSEDQKLALSIERARAYVDAGADSVYPIFATEETTIKTLAGALKVPVNILAKAGVPDLDVLQRLGVARVSFGPNVHRATLLTMESVLRDLRDFQSHRPVTGLLG